VSAPAGEAAGTTPLGAEPLGAAAGGAAARFDPGLAVEPLAEPFGFRYGPGVFGPAPELRRLDQVRPSLPDPRAAGPDPVYAIAMDVGREEHRAELARRMLLFGVVTYAAGRLGDGPVRSQGHVHRVSAHSGWRPPELYEVWRGRAVVYMQERAADDPGRCFAVEAGPGEVVVVPPGWAHATVSADPREPLTFGAWCDREYGFEYEAVRARAGLAWQPALAAPGDGAGGGGAAAALGLVWRPNAHYRATPLVRRGPRPYPDLGVEPGVPVYRQFARDPGRFQWVSRPALAAAVWEEFEP
jgi:glucose-6-phosphate isomerase